MLKDDFDKYVSVILYFGIFLINFILHLIPLVSTSQWGVKVKKHIFKNVFIKITKALNLGKLPKEIFSFIAKVGKKKYYLLEREGQNW